MKTYYSMVLYFARALGISKRDINWKPTSSTKGILELKKDVQITIQNQSYTVFFREVGKWIHVNPKSRKPYFGKKPEIEFREYILKRGKKQILRIDDDRRYNAYLQDKIPKELHLHIRVPDSPKLLLKLILRPKTCNAINFLMYLHYRQLTGEAPV